MKRWIVLIIIMLPFWLLNAKTVNGVYETDFNKMTLHQEGNQVTGTYEHDNGRIEGTLTGRILRGWWYQTQSEGRFEFEFNTDFTQFTGKWGYNEDEPSSEWNGKKTGILTEKALEAVSGIYETDFSKMTLHQAGNQVTGTYEHDNGRIEGTLTGRILRGWWYQTQSEGRFEFEFNTDFTQFTGKWGYNEDEPSSEWNGKKTGILTEKALEAVSGIYETDFSKMTLHQAGNQVTGTYEHDNGRIEGTLTGRILRGWWYQTQSEGRFEFEFNTDFTQFTGKWGYNEDEPSSEWYGKKINP